MTAIGAADPARRTRAPARPRRAHDDRRDPGPARRPVGADPARPGSRQDRRRLQPVRRRDPACDRRRRVLPAVPGRRTVPGRPGRDPLPAAVHPRHGPVPVLPWPVYWALPIAAVVWAIWMLRPRDHVVARHGLLPVVAGHAHHARCRQPGPAVHRRHGAGDDLVLAGRRDLPQAEPVPVRPVRDLEAVVVDRARGRDPHQPSLRRDVDRLHRRRPQRPARARRCCTTSGRRPRSRLPLAAWAGRTRRR